MDILWESARWLVLLMIALGTAPNIGRADGRDEPSAGWSGQVPRVSGARHFFVATGGKPENPGTRQAPWDLVSALSGRRKVAPGDVLWIRGGAYRSDIEKFELGLAGKEGAPVHVRAYPGERATILDNGITTLESASHVWLWDLELTSSVPPKDRKPEPTPPRFTDAPASVGLWVRWGQGCKFINLAVHGNPGGGVDWWTEAGGGEIHGCLIHDNGWRPPDSKHGHALYTQNRDGLKTISNCIMSVPTDDPYSIYAFGSPLAYVDNFLIEDNIIQEKGSVLIGGGRPSHGIRVLRNYLHGVNMRIGNAADNEDCEVLDNVIAGGTLSIEKYKTAVERGNIRHLPDRLAVLIPNKYDPDRAHLVVYNGAKSARVAADAAPFLRPGDAYRLMNPRDSFGTPISQGMCAGATIDVPMEGEFAAFVVLKGRGKP